ncbi:MAG: nitroreductase family protein [Bacteroidetes bacterium]|nr:nitroreductase family protein [Bacteroidota bacterium]
MLMSLIQKRRSTRTFKKELVEPEKIAILIEAMLRPPSSKERYPWEFIIIDDKDLLKSLSAAKIQGSTFLKGAPLGVVVCADQDKSDMCIEDTSIAATYIQLVAESIGLGSCWIQIRGRQHDESKTAQQYVAQVLKIPDNIMVQTIIAIGYKKGVFPAHEKDSLKYDRIHFNDFGDQYFK